MKPLGVARFLQNVIYVTVEPADDALRVVAGAHHLRLAPTAVDPFACCQATSRNVASASIMLSR